MSRSRARKPGFLSVFVSILLAVVLATLIGRHAAASHTGSVLGAASDGARPAAAETVVDLSWLPSVDAAGHSFSSDSLSGRAVIFLKTGLWCIPCGADKALEQISTAAAVHRDLFFVVLLVKATDEEAVGASKLYTTANVAVFTVPADAGTGPLGKEFGPSVPSAVALTSDHQAGPVATGADSVSRLLGSLG